MLDNITIERKPDGSVSFICRETVNDEVIVLWEKNFTAEQWEAVKASV